MQGTQKPSGPHWESVSVKQSFKLPHRVTCLHVPLIQVYANSNYLQSSSIMQGTPFVVYVIKKFIIECINKKI